MLVRKLDENRIIIGRTPCRVPADLFKSDTRFHRGAKRFVAPLIRHDSPHLGAISISAGTRKKALMVFRQTIEPLDQVFMFLSCSLWMKSLRLCQC